MIPNGILLYSKVGAYTLPLATNGSRCRETHRQTLGKGQWTLHKRGIKDYMRQKDQGYQENTDHRINTSGHSFMAELSYCSSPSLSCMFLLLHGSSFLLQPPCPLKPGEPKPCLCLFSQAIIFWHFFLFANQNCGQDSSFLVNSS